MSMSSLVITASVNGRSVSIRKMEKGGEKRKRRTATTVVLHAELVSNLVGVLRGVLHSVATGRDL
jgi:hypothetical protein